jgi:DNA-binding transcriptional LysR family regulator
LKANCSFNFARSHSGIVATDGGMAIITKAREILQNIDGLRALSKSEEWPSDVLVRIASGPSFCIAILPRIISSVTRRQAGMHFSIVECGNISAIRHMCDGDVDIAFVTSRNQYPSPFCFTPLFTCPIVACVSHAHPLSRHEQISLYETVDYPQVIFDGYQFQKFILDKMSRFKPPYVMYAGNSVASMKAMLLETNGVSFVPSIALYNDPYVKNGDLIALPLAHNEVEPSTFGYVLNTSQTLQPYIQAIVEESVFQVRSFNSPL